MKTYVGSSGWSYPDWEGVVYPQEKPKGFSPLAYLAQYVDAVELNMSFYRPPTEAMSAKWVKTIAFKPDFLFTAKLWQRFTHERDRPWTAQEVDQFKRGLMPLHESDRFGALLMQFPWSFQATPESRDWLSRLAEAFAEFPRVVEVRHASWGADESRDFLAARQLNFCNIDEPHSSQNLSGTSFATGPIAYYRFHGRNAKAWFAKDAGRDKRYDYLYSANELTPWVERIRKMSERVQRLFVMNNNHYRGQGIVNSLQIKSMLTGAPVPVPPSLRVRYPVLNDLAAGEPGQATLFSRPPE
jgi:uncharacterized protein YecE (DUF72 family)